MAANAHCYFDVTLTSRQWRNLNLSQNHSKNCGDEFENVYAACFNIKYILKLKQLHLDIKLNMQITRTEKDTHPVDQVELLLALKAGGVSLVGIFLCFIIF